MISSENTLEVRNLRTYFYTYNGIVKALEGVNFKVRKNQSFGIVGETGCGKSVTALSILRLIKWPPGKIIDGEIIFEGRDILTMNEDEMRQQIRGKSISMIFQEPVIALNPVLKVGRQISEVYEKNEKLDKKSSIKKTIETLNSVKIADPEMIVNRYPHELSGGMAQRAMIAMAIACNPKLLIADEPTTNLDVTIQAQILELISELMKNIGTSLLLITHNMGVVAETCDNVAVMYAGSIVECAKTTNIFKESMHPYTRGLIGCIPEPNKKGSLNVIKGSVPNLINPPTGCRFHPRCENCEKICKKKTPPAVEVKPGHSVSCFLYN